MVHFGSICHIYKFLQKDLVEDLVDSGVLVSKQKHLV